MMDLIFRDESSHVIKKATKATKEWHTKPKTHSSEVTTRRSPGVIGPPPEDALRQHTTCLQFVQVPTSAVLGTHESWSSGLTGQLPILGAWDQRKSSNADTHSDRSPQQDRTDSLQREKLRYTQELTLEQQGVAYFFARFVTADEVSNMRPFDFVFDIWRPTRNPAERQTDGVMAAMTAVGLAALSNLKTCPKMLECSRKSYGTALHLTKTALQRPRDVIKDTTMLSVLILSIYELLTGRDRQTAQAWQEHINGAAMLAKLRGAGQFSSSAGTRMFKGLMQTVLISCVQRHLPLPSALADLRAELEDVSPDVEGALGWRLSQHIERVLQLRHDISRGTLVSTYDAIAELLDVDKAISNIAATSLAADDQNGYTLAQLSRTAGVAFGNYCHVYSSPAQAAAWNHLCSIRILVHEAIIQKIQTGPAKGGVHVPREYQAILSHSVRLLDKLHAAILATVPQHLGNIKFKDVKIASRDAAVCGGLISVKSLDARKPPIYLSSTVRVASAMSTSPLATEPPLISCESRRSLLAGLSEESDKTGETDEAASVMTLALASNTIIWPLYLVGNSPLCTLAAKDYVVTRLMDLYRHTGLSHADTVASMVAAKEVSASWHQTARILEALDTSRTADEEFCI